MGKSFQRVHYIETMSTKKLPFEVHFKHTLRSLSFSFSGALKVLFRPSSLQGIVPLTADRSSVAYLRIISRSNIHITHAHHVHAHSHKCTVSCGTCKKVAVSLTHTQKSQTIIARATASRSLSNDTSTRPPPPASLGLEWVTSSEALGERFACFLLARVSTRITRVCVCRTRLFCVQKYAHTQSTLNLLFSELLLLAVKTLYVCMCVVAVIRLIFGAIFSPYSDKSRCFRREYERERGREIRQMKNWASLLRS